MIARKLARLGRKIASVAVDHVTFEGSVLPTPDRRHCGCEFKDNRFYIESSEREARRLVEHCACDRSTRVLDMGCGQGRLAIGIIRVLGDLPYMGLDVHRRSITWCRRHIQKAHPVSCDGS